MATFNFNTKNTSGIVDIARIETSGNLKFTASFNGGKPVKCSVRQQGHTVYISVMADEMNGQLNAPIKKGLELCIPIKSHNLCETLHAIDNTERVTSTPIAGRKGLGGIFWSNDSIAKMNYTEKVQAGLE